jgi:hypothetical protein
VREYLKAGKKVLMLHTAGKGSRNQPITGAEAASKANLKTPVEFRGKRVEVYGPGDPAVAPTAGGYGAGHGDGYQLRPVLGGRQGRKREYEARLESIRAEPAVTQEKEGLGRLLVDEDGTLREMHEKKPYLEMIKKFGAEEGLVNMALYRMNGEVVDGLVRHYGKFVEEKRELDTSLDLLEPYTRG